MPIRLTCLSAALSLAIVTLPATAGPPPAPFESIDGGALSLADYAGRPVLLVNTASLCGFAGQYDDLQTLWDSYRDQGLMVLAVPSDDFRQELATAAEVKEFCAINFDLTLPMTDITPVRGEKAHPVYAWIRDEAGFEPTWNFNKVLIGGDGRILGTWGATARPTGAPIRRAIEAALDAAD